MDSTSDLPSYYFVTILHLRALFKLQQKTSMLTNPLELSGIICNLLPSCIIFPTNANNFNFKPGMISLLPKFHGLDSENPYLHFKEFEEVCYIII